MCASILCILAHSYLSKQNIQNCHVIVTYDFIQCTVKPCHVILYWPWPYTGARVAQWVRLLDLTAHTSLSCHVILYWPWPYTGARVAQWVRLLDLTAHTSLSCHVILYWPWPYTGARVAQWVRLLDLTAHTSLSCHVILYWPYISYLSKKLRSYLMTFAIQWKGCFPHYEKSYNLKLNCLVCYEISHWQKDVFSIQYKYSSYDI
jgi:hypothetical protein